MTTPTREQVVQWEEAAGLANWWNNGSDWKETFDFHLTQFAALARADLEAELESLRKDAVPEGWKAIHIKTGNEYQVIGEAIDATNLHSNQLMVIYRRDGKTFVREAEEFQEKFAAEPKEK